MFLYLFMCMYGFVKNEQKQDKTDKNEHENGKCQKPKPGKSNGQSLSSKSKIQPWKFIKCQEKSLEEV